MGETDLQINWFQTVQGFKSQCQKSELDSVFNWEPVQLIEHRWYMCSYGCPSKDMCKHILGQLKFLDRPEGAALHMKVIPEFVVFYTSKIMVEPWFYF